MVGLDKARVDGKILGPPRKLDPDQVETARRLRGEKVSVREIGRQFRVSASTVGRYLKEELESRCRFRLLSGESRVVTCYVPGEVTALVVVPAELKESSSLGSGGAWAGGFGVQQGSPGRIAARPWAWISRAGLRLSS